MKTLLRPPRIVCGLLCTSLAMLAHADDASDCAASAGTYLTGVVVTAPTFQSGKRQDGIELSHTHIQLIDDVGGQMYDIAVDDVFASGYVARQEIVPPR